MICNFALHLKPYGIKIVKQSMKTLNRAYLENAPHKLVYITLSFLTSENTGLSQTP